jgi:hypothetical protein
VGSASLSLPTSNLIIDGNRLLDSFALSANVVASINSALSSFSPSFGGTVSALGGGSGAFLTSLYRGSLTEEQWASGAKMTTSFMTDSETYFTLIVGTTTGYWVALLPDGNWSSVNPVNLQFPSNVNTPAQKFIGIFPCSEQGIVTGSLTYLALRSCSSSVLTFALGDTSAMNSISFDGGANNLVSLQLGGSASPSVLWGLYLYGINSMTLASFEAMLASLPQGYDNGCGFSQLVFSHDGSTTDMGTTSFSYGNAPALIALATDKNWNFYDYTGG